MKSLEKVKLGGRECEPEGQIMGGRFNLGK